MNIEKRLNLVLALTVLSTALTIEFVSAAGRDPTLYRIAADEPVVQTGFPPLPECADLSGVANSELSGSKSHAPQRGVSSNFSGRTGPQAVKLELPNSRVAGGREPVLNAESNLSSSIDPPVPIVLSEAVTQDLSPEDEFSGRPGSQKNRSSASKNAMKNLVRTPLLRAGSLAPSLFNRAIQF